ncbi:unnamed protein product [Didymodactylos carnosus]|uniref:Uncharacterized protein n=1 Tax=Didymodactylos carnosus TaxID=1234261 RepID=A0A815XJK2_9BILA|nr:unnamed protein product [Didymodactylos carnosus]CAF4419552.1 unnamed protein product [Didymodactylos carnosus]
MRSFTSFERYYFYQNHSYIQSALPDVYHLTDTAVLFFDTHLSYASEYHKYPLDLNNMINQKRNDGIIIFNTVTNSYEINQNGPNSESGELLVSSVAASVQLIDSWADQTSESATLRRTPLQTISNLQSADQLDSLVINTLFSADETTTERQHPSLVIDKKKHPFVDVNSRQNALLQYLLATLTAKQLDAIPYN